MTADRLAALAARDKFVELADLVETVTALDLTPPSRSGGHAVPGSRLPPGLNEILDADEVAAALTAVHDWAEFCTHVLVDEADVDAVPDATPARLRLASQHAEHFIQHEDEMFALSIEDDLHDHLKAMRRLSRRGTRVVRTGMRCKDVSCGGWLISALGCPGASRHDDDLECDRCHARIPYVVWSSWPKARVTYVTVEHAARIAGTTVDAIKRRASRGKWRRVGTGRDVRYHVDDVRGDAPVLASA